MSGQFPKSPNKIDSKIPSAVGSRKSLMWEGRDKTLEAQDMVNETARYITEFTNSKLPPEVLKQVDIMAGLEAKLYNYVNQSYVNMFNRYAITVEDEMVKKVRDFVDKEELKSLARYTPKDIADLLDKIGGSEKFHTGEIEKSVVNMYGHLQGHVQRGVYDLEVETNALLRQKTDVGALVRGENAYAIVKCAFKDNQLKPKSVFDIKLAFNVLASELISPIFHYQVTVEHLIKEQLSQHISSLIEVEIESLQNELVDNGRTEMSKADELFEKIKSTDKFTDDNSSDPNSRRYTILAKKFMDKIEGLRAEIDQNEYDPLNIREQIKNIIDSESIRDRGFNSVVNTLISILDTSKLGYQFCDNKKNAREVVIREYEDESDANIPDESYDIHMAYYDQNQILNMKRNYNLRMEAFIREVDAVIAVVNQLYEKKKIKLGLFKKIHDFEDLASAVMNSRWRKERREFARDEDELHWDKLKFRDEVNTFVEKNNKTYSVELKNTSKKFSQIQEVIQTTFGHETPMSRVVIQERLDYLFKEFDKFKYEINPYHLQPGLLLDINIKTTKRKQFIMKLMANVLNEFLYRVSQGFADAAMASFKRRRSTLRTDIDQSFEKPATKAETTFFKSAYSNDGEGAKVASGGASEPKKAAGNDQRHSSVDSSISGSVDLSSQSTSEDLKEL